MKIETKAAIEFDLDDIQELIRARAQELTRAKRIEVKINTKRIQNPNWNSEDPGFQMQWIDTIYAEVLATELPIHQNPDC